VYGPHLAQLYASSRVHEQIQSLGHFFNPTNTLDQKLNLASANYELAQSIPQVVEYFGPNPSATWAQMAEHEEQLQRILLEFLASEGRVAVIGESSASKELRVPVISFVVRGLGSRRLVEEVERRSAYGFRSGHMYSHRLLAEVCGLEDVEDGVVRVSFLHYNTGEWGDLFGCLRPMLIRTVAEVQGLVEVLREVLASS
jgi:selenocysteine lyase/cysteine desulfurase